MVFLGKHQPNDAPYRRGQAMVQHYWEESSKPDRGHFRAVSNSKACPHLTYPMSIARKNSRVREEVLEVEKPSRQSEQGSQSGKGEVGQVTQCKHMNSGVAWWAGICHSRLSQCIARRNLKESA